MAEKRTIDINIKNNADEATKDFKQFNKALDETAKSAKNVNSTFEEVYGDLQPLTTRLGEAEDRLYELALAGDTTSKEYQELLTKVGEYRKVQIQTDLAVDGAAQTMTQKLGSALNGATSAFAATQGAMALFGSENEALNESLLKVQSALAIQQGVKGLSDAYKELSIGTKIATAAKAAYATVTGTTTGLLKAFRIALASTGIGLIVVAVGALIANFDKLLKPLNAAKNALKSFGDAIGLTNFKQKEAEEAQIKRIEADRKRHKQAMANATKELAIIDKQIAAEKSRQKVIEDTYELELRKAKGNFEEIEKINESLTQSKKDSIDEEERLFLESQKFRIKQEEAGIAEFQAIVDKNIARGRTDHQKELSEIARRKATLSRLQKEFLNKDYIELEQFNIRRQNLDIDYEKGVEQRRKEANQKYKTYLQNRLNARRQIEDLENSLLEEGIEKELEINRDKFRRLREDTEKNTELTLTERKRLNDLYTEQELKAEQEIRQKYFDEEKNERLELLNFIDEANKAQVEKEKAKNLAIVEASKKAYEEQKALDEKAAKEKAERQKAQIDLAIQGLQLVAGFAELFAGDDEKRQKKAFQIKKAADIAAATVDGYRAVLSTYAQTPGGPVLKGIAAGIAGGFASLQIANIAKQQFEGGGGAGGDFSADTGGGTGEVITPEFNVVGDAGINQLAQLQQPTQAYVVSGEVTSAQALDRNRVTNATL